MDNEDIFKDYDLGELNLDKTKNNFSNKKESLTIWVDDKWVMYFRADVVNVIVKKKKVMCLKKKKIFWKKKVNKYAGKYYGIES